MKKMINRSFSLFTPAETKTICDKNVRASVWIVLYQNKNKKDPGRKKNCGSCLRIWLRLTTFQGINFTVQQIWILAWFVKRQNIAGLWQQTFHFCSADSFFIIFCFLLNWGKNWHYFRIAVWQSDSMKRNFEGFTFYSVWVFFPLPGIITSETHALKFLSHIVLVSAGVY